MNLSQKKKTWRENCESVQHKRTIQQTPVFEPQTPCIPPRNHLHIIWKYVLLPFRAWHSDHVLEDRIGSEIKNSYICRSIGFRSPSPIKNTHHEKLLPQLLIIKLFVKNLSRQRIAWNKDKRWLVGISNSFGVDKASVARRNKF